MFKFQLLIIFLYFFSAQAEERIGIMSFNVENLFDTAHDPGKEDQTFLPMKLKETKKHKSFCNTIKVQKWKDDCLTLNWNEENLSKKMQNISEVIKQVNNGRGPEILILQEVENKKVLEKLNTEYLSELGYKSVVLIEGSDKRGIDVAILSRFISSSTPKLLKVKFENPKKNINEDSRGILTVQLELPNKENLLVNAVHFPAPFHDRSFRNQSFQKLNKYLFGLPKGTLSITGGDFNLTSEENKKFNTLKTFVDPFWIASTHLPCVKCLGTSYYEKDKSWSFLDMILVSKSFESSKTWKLDLNSFRVVNTVAQQRKEGGTPASFDQKTQLGVSDHWPVYLELFK